MTASGRRIRCPLSRQRCASGGAATLPAASSSHRTIRGATSAVEADTLEDEWTDATGRDPGFTELSRLLGEFFPKKLVQCRFEEYAKREYRAFIQHRGEMLLPAICKVLRGETLTGQDEAILSTRGEADSLHKCRADRGYDLMR